jgi:hypothetical protein
MAPDPVLTAVVRLPPRLTETLVIPVGRVAAWMDRACTAQEAGRGIRIERLNRDATLFCGFVTGSQELLHRGDAIPAQEIGLLKLALEVWARS